MIYLTFLCAIALSAIAGYYSIIGLAAIFVGAFWPVVLMGSVLEVSKLVTASWLYRNWKIAPFLLRTYLTCAVLIIMLITSMGIFGFLAKAHIDSTLNSNANNVELKTLTVQEKITRDRLDYLIARAKDPSTASDKLDRQIQTTQKELSDISKRKLPLLREDVKLTADVGPIKYVAELIYGDADNGIDKAVKLVIMIIMVVFDPLAVLLLISGNISLADDKQEEVNEPKVEIQSVYVPPLPVEETEVADKDIVVEDTQRTEDVVETKEDEAKVEIQRENIATIEDIPQHEDILEQKPERPVEYVLDPVFGNPIKKLEPKYDYSDPYTFREKENK